MKPVLLVIDVQKGILRGWMPNGANRCITPSNISIAASRYSGPRTCRIFCVQHMDEEDKLMPGEEGFDLPEELQNPAHG